MMVLLNLSLYFVLFEFLFTGTPSDIPCTEFVQYSGGSAGHLATINAFKATCMGATPQASLGYGPTLHQDGQTMPIFYFQELHYKATNHFIMAIGWQLYSSFRTAPKDTYYGTNGISGFLYEGPPSSQVGPCSNALSLYWNDPNLPTDSVLIMNGTSLPVGSNWTLMAQGYSMCDCTTNIGKQYWRGAEVLLSNTSTCQF